jgi:hypothetical protein
MEETETCGIATSTARPELMSAVGQVSILWESKDRRCFLESMP